MIERRPFSGECQAEVVNKYPRDRVGADYICRRITDIVQNGEWRCGFHTDSNLDAFVVKGQFVGEEEATA